MTGRHIDKDRQTETDSLTYRQTNRQRDRQTDRQRDYKVGKEKAGMY